jgi:hypothetical protein
MLSFGIADMWCWVLCRGRRGLMMFGVAHNIVAIQSQHGRNIGGEGRRPADVWMLHATCSQHDSQWLATCSQHLLWTLNRTADGWFVSHPTGTKVFVLAPGTDVRALAVSKYKIRWRGTREALASGSPDTMYRFSDKTTLCRWRPQGRGAEGCFISFFLFCLFSFPFLFFIHIFMEHFTIFFFLFLFFLLVFLFYLYFSNIIFLFHVFFLLILLSLYSISFTFLFHFYFFFIFIYLLSTFFYFHFYILSF